MAWWVAAQLYLTLQHPCLSPCIMRMCQTQPLVRHMLGVK
jgi:hypothetical protein